MLIVLLLAACGSSGPKLKESALSALVLHKADLPSGFSQFADNPQGRADIHPGPREVASRFGRLGGWIARFRRADVSSVHVRGPLVVESRADLFKSSSGAKQDLSAYNDEYSATAPTLAGAPIEVPQIGDDALGFRFGSGLDRYVLLAWRKANATASVLVEGSAVTVADAVRLARLQQKRVAAQAAL